MIVDDGDCANTTLINPTLILTRCYSTPNFLIGGFHLPKSAATKEALLLRKRVSLPLATPSVPIDQNFLLGQATTIKPFVFL